MTTLPYRELLSGDAPHKPLLKKKSSQGGRNGFGRITTRHQGGGHKKRFRDIDFSYNKKNIPAKIETVEYDPFRSAFIGLALYRDGERRYVIIPKEMKVGDTFLVAENAPLTAGNRLPLGAIPVAVLLVILLLEHWIFWININSATRVISKQAQIILNQQGVPY